MTNARSRRILRGPAARATCANALGLLPIMPKNSPLGAPEFDTSGVDVDLISDVARATSRALANWQNAVRARGVSDARAMAEFEGETEQLMDEIVRALATGQTSNVRWLARQLRTKRQRREWLVICDRIWKGPFLPHEVHNLAAVDGEAWKLMPSDDNPSGARSTIEDARRNERLTTVAGFAARLACDCGAFGYSPGDFKRAKKAFENLSAEGIDEG